VEIVAVNIPPDAPGTRQFSAFNMDGSLLQGWPMDTINNAAVSMGDISASIPGLEVLAPLTIPPTSGQSRPGKGVQFLTAYSGDGSILPGWPVTTTSTIKALPISVDTDGDGLAEVFAVNQAFTSSGAPIPGWPNTANALAAGDLDGDSHADILTFEQDRSIRARNGDGTLVSSFNPPSLVGLLFIANNVIGDLEGDGTSEVLLPLHNGGPKTPDLPANFIWILTTKGEVKHTIPLPAGLANMRMTLALGDLDCDGAAEILAQTVDKLYAWTSDGTSLVGWPKNMQSLGSYTPVIGDVDGDGQPDVVTMTTNDGSQVQLQAYDKSGIMLPHFPKALDSGGAAVVAIADVDNDSRNEIIVASTSRRGSTRDLSVTDRLWAFDLHGSSYGPVQWGQFGGGPQHQNYYSPTTSSCPR